MKSRAAIAFKAGAPLEIAEVDVQGPRAGEVMVEIKATGVCHTDAFTLSGDDPEAHSLLFWVTKAPVLLSKLAKG